MKKFSFGLFVMALFFTTLPVTGKGVKRTWQDFLLLSLKSIEAASPEGEFGLYIKNLRTGKELSYKGDEFWYLASGIKVPVALEVLRQVDEKALTLETKVEVLETDYIDGAGELNYIKSGSQVSIRLLLDQSLTFSDNTASDILIRQIGLEKVNALTAAMAPKTFAPITTLAEVRRRVFSNFHPAAKELSNADFIRLRVLKDENAKLDFLAKALKVEKSQFKYPDLESAYEAYYAERLNSATLRGYGALLEKLDQGGILKEETQKYLMDVLERVETGKRRIKAGLSKSYVFAHKTGSQHKRYCDMGILTNGTPKSDRILVVSCTRKFPSEIAEKIFEKIGEAIRDSGVFSKKSRDSK